MATITITSENDLEFVPSVAFRGIGKVDAKFVVEGDLITQSIVLTIPRMSETRFENVVKRVLTKNLTEQGITPLSIEYSE